MAALKALTWIPQQDGPRRHKMACPAQAGAGPVLERTSQNQRDGNLGVLLLEGTIMPAARAD
jgi:hypothetical protein